MNCAPPSKKHKHDEILDAFAYNAENTHKLAPTSDDCTDSTSNSEESDNNNEIVLDTWQLSAYNALLENTGPLFVTGAAGTGKSTLVRKIVQELVDETVHICSSTGKSAILVGGTTFHSYFGLRPTNDDRIPASTFAKQLRTYKQYNRIKENLQSVTVLIIDEISMISGQLLDYAEQLLRLIRESVLPFGGARILLTGDFAQLQAFSSRADRGQPAKLAFHAQCWKCVRTFYLEQSHRHSGDVEYSNLLRRARRGTISQSDSRLLQTRVLAQFPDDGIAPTHLFSRKADARVFNAKKLAELDETTEKVFRASITVSGSELTKRMRGDASKFIRTNVLAPPTLTLRIGATVMLLANIDIGAGLVNGSTGKVIGYTHYNGKAHSSVPIVQFTNGLVQSVVPYTWSFPSSISGRAWSGAYSQIPLDVAYGYTIHKSQGATLDRVVISLSRSAIFAPHMAYTALSRVRSLQSLSIVAFDGRTIYINPEITPYLGCG